MRTLSDLLNMKAKQEKMKKEHKKRHVLYDIKDIFIDTIVVFNLDEKSPIIKN